MDDILQVESARIGRFRRSVERKKRPEEKKVVRRENVYDAISPRDGCRHAGRRRGSRIPFGISRCIIFPFSDHNAMNTPLLWNTSTGRQLRSFSGHTDSITDLAFSPDGRLLFSASRDVTIMIWDAESGGKLAALIGHTQAAENLAVSPDGSILASTSYKNGVFLWGLPGG